MTMPSSNPAFGRGYASAISGSQYGASGQSQTAPAQYDPYNAPSPYARSTVRYMTMDDVVTKTGVSFLVTVLTAAATWGLLPQNVALGLALPAVLIGLVLGLVIAFKAIASPVATLAYAAVEGVFLGAISEVFNQYFPGVVVQAVIGTFGVFAGMLI